jgi:hypothetical protein
VIVLVFGGNWGDATDDDDDATLDTDGTNVAVVNVSAIFGGSTYAGKKGTGDEDDANNVESSFNEDDNCVVSHLWIGRIVVVVWQCGWNNICTGSAKVNMIGA